MTSPRLGIIANTGKPRVGEILGKLLPWLHRKKIDFVISDDLGDLVDITNSVSMPVEGIADESDFILSFGGDGTFLQTAHTVFPREVPIIGVNLGSFGYLAEVGTDQLYKRIDDLLHGRYHLQERSMLEGSIEGNDDGNNLVALNDIVIEKGKFPRTIRLETSIDDEYLNTFNADGLIVSTPTGSTGYSLSVGGPIMGPQTDALIVDPICPHMLANRPLVVEGKSVITITAFSEAGEFQITVDGKSVQRPDSGTKVIIRRALHKTRMVIFERYSFYELLRNKLHWRA